MTDEQNIMESTLNSMVSNFQKQIISKTQEELEEYWFFKWNKDRSVEWNIYNFFELLDLYKKHCRWWEEHHNGVFCVVERVRDTYLIPKIKEFKIQLKEYDEV